MKKFRFHILVSSDEYSSESDASDDEVPDVNVPSQIIKEQPKINVEKNPGEQHRNLDTADEIQLLKKPNGDDSDKYKSYITQKTKSLLESFPSNSDDETITNKNNTKTIEFSSTTTSDTENNNEAEKEQTIDVDSNQDQTNDQQNSKIVNMHLKMPRSPKISQGQRQKKLNNSIKMIYDFFDHKISVQTIILAIHDHGGMIKDAFATLSKYPNKYANNYSLHDLPNSANKIIIDSYLNIHE